MASIAHLYGRRKTARDAGCLRSQDPRRGTTLLLIKLLELLYEYKPRRPRDPDGSPRVSSPKRGRTSDEKRREERVGVRRREERGRGGRMEGRGWIEEKRFSLKYYFTSEKTRSQMTRNLEQQLAKLWYEYFTFYHSCIPTTLPGRRGRVRGDERLRPKEYKSLPHHRFSDSSLKLLSRK